MRPDAYEITALSIPIRGNPGGLAALVRMAGYAERMGCTFRISSPSPSVVKIMRITGLDRAWSGSLVSDSK